MCCDWFDILIGVAGGFVVGCVCTAVVAKAVLMEQTNAQQNPCQRTYLKENNRP